MVKFKIVLSVLLLLVFVNGFGADPDPSCGDDGDDSDCDCCKDFIEDGGYMSGEVFIPYTLDPGQGLTLCCDGEYYACYNPKYPEADPDAVPMDLDARWQKAIDDCTSAHEQHHKANDAASCLGGDDNPGPVPAGSSSSDTRTPAQRECDAVQAELQCLDSKLSACTAASDVTCMGELNDALCGLIIAANLPGDPNSPVASNCGFVDTTFGVGCS